MKQYPLTENAQPFIRLGDLLHDEAQRDRRFAEVIERQHQRNAWFTPLFCQRALDTVAALLTEEALSAFVARYVSDDLRWNQRKRVATIVGGNYPLAGFRDLLYILLSGNDAVCKSNPSDTLLLPALVECLIELEPSWRERIVFVERLADYDAVIAECKPDGVAAFERYFKAVPHILRTPQHTAAVITGEESADELKALSEDIYLYFGLAPRAVAKLYVPRGYDFVPLLRMLHEESRAIADHHQYLNNLDYQKSIRLMCSKFYMDAGTFLFLEETKAERETSVIHYRYYDDYPTALDNESELLASAREGIRFGEANRPALSDYPNQKDVMLFLGSL